MPGAFLHGRKKNNIIKILYLVKIVACKRMRISKSEKCGIRNFGLWNPEYFQALDSDSNLYQWMLDSGFRIQLLVGFRIPWNYGCQDCLGFLYME